MARVLLSSATEDRPAMRRLAEALRRAGHEPSIDVDELAPGAPWPAAIKRALARADALIIGLSAATAPRGYPWLRHEIDALLRDAAQPKPLLVARLDDTPLPRDPRGVGVFSLSGDEVFDLRRESWDRDVEVLIAALARPASSFFGRQDELEWLARHLGMGMPVAVVGEPGLGKTALALAYAHRHAAEYPGGVFYASQDDVASLLAGELSTRSEPSLLIIDDLDGDDWSFLDRIPGRTIHTLITTRTRPAGFPGRVLELAPLLHEDAWLLFERRAGPIDAPAEIQERNQIVAAAGGIPAALVSAAELYRRGWRMAYSAASIASSLARAAPPDSPERLLLEGMIPFAAEAVPLAWAALVGGAGTQAEAAPVARRLEAAGLVQLGPDSNTITVHPLARQALRDQIAHAVRRATRARAEELVARWMASPVTGEPVPSDLVLEHAEVLAADDDDDAPRPWRGAIQERLADLHRHSGHKASALQLLERAERITAQHRPAYGDLHAIVAAQLASLSSELGDPARARRALAEAMAAAESQPVSGAARWRDIDPGAYLEALAGAIDTAERIDDPGNAARAAFLLADFHGRRGAWERAAPLAEQGLRAARRANEPILVARAYRLLADVALHGSRYEDARASYEEALRRLDELGAEELAATTRLLYINLLLQLNRREAAVRHAERLRSYLSRAPAGWSYRAEAVQTLRLFDGSVTEGKR